MVLELGIIVGFEGEGRCARFINVNFKITRVNYNSGLQPVGCDPILGHVSFKNRCYF